MKSHWLNQIGDWNPQLLREIKGRLKTRNILLAMSISILGQFVLLIYAQSLLPSNNVLLYNSSHKYCTGKFLDGFSKCLGDELGNILINWQLWYLDVFTLLSIIGSFTLLVGGTYLLISNLSTEEQRDTLNFIRLSPQSPQSILLGKMLGVPIMLYVVALLAIPLHLWLGFAAKIPSTMIFSFYALIFAACFFYYSGALLFGLIGSWLGGFQAWLGSGTVLGFLIFSKEVLNRNVLSDNPLVLWKLINPYYLVPHSYVSSTYLPLLSKFHWFSEPIGVVFLSTACFALLIYGIGSYFIWQSLQRCFRDSHITMLSKRQSYILTTCFAIITIGCANWQNLVFGQYYNYGTLSENIAGLLFLNLGLFLYLIAALNPHRQTLQDWARYRHSYHFEKLGNKSLIQDLIWGEKSPGTLAIALNAMIAITCLSGFILVSKIDISTKIPAFVSLAFCGILAVTYAALVQILLFMKNEQRLFWTTGVLGAVIVLPLILSILFSQSGNNFFIWLFSIAAPLMILFPSGNYAPSFNNYVIAFVGHLIILGLLVFQLTRTLNKAGESSTKAMAVKN
ncbi:MULTISPECIES: hypothetical protein [unclassified Anabaena]|uniref:hypothetical protein n=1 Tax=unclassified Anabaena TaxID=2619674 RepID=UPI0039C6829A